MICNDKHVYIYGTRAQQPAQPLGEHYDLIILGVYIITYCAYINVLYCTPQYNALEYMRTLTLCACDTPAQPLGDHNILLNYKYILLKYNNVIIYTRSRSGTAPTSSSTTTSATPRQQIKKLLNKPIYY